MATTYIARILVLKDGREVQHLKTQRGGPPPDETTYRVTPDIIRTPRPPNDMRTFWVAKSEVARERKLCVRIRGE